MTQILTGVPLAVVLFVAAAVLLRRRSNPYAMAALAATLAPVPALFAWFRATRALVDRFQSISGGVPAEMATSLARALTAANDSVLQGQLASAAIVVAAILLALLGLTRKPLRPAESSSSRSRLVAATAFAALVGSVVLYEIATDAILFPLAVVASQQGRADPNLALTTEAAKALFMDSTSQDAVSSKVGEYLGAATLGSVLIMGLCVVGFVVGLVTSAGPSFPRSSAVVGLVLVVLLGAATARELVRHQAIEGELQIVETRSVTPETARPK